MSIHPRMLMLACLASAAACSDGVSPEHPLTRPATGEIVQVYECQVTVATQSVACVEPVSGPSNARRLIVGGSNGQYVLLTASNYVFTSDSMSFDVTMQNRIVQTMGTTDGVTEDVQGIRIFFTSDPTETPADPNLPSSVSLGNPDGYGFFLQPVQPYFQYAGLLAGMHTSAPRRWRFDVVNVAQIRFTVLVSTAVQYPQGWMSLAADTWVGTAGQVDTLAATARHQFGYPLAEPVVWSSANPAVAVVAALSDSTAEITGMSPGTTWVRAVSAVNGVRRDSVFVTVGLYPSAWLDLADSWSGTVGQVGTLTATVFDVFGQPVPEPVVWSSAEPGVATVEPLSETTARITATGSGTTWVRAVSTVDGARHDSAFVMVGFGGDM